MFHRLALSYDKLDRRPEAFESWRRGNTSHAGQWNASEHSTTTDALIKSFSADAMRRLPRSANTSSTPLFIVGMFRSGTTLTEQVISAHPQAHGAGELSALFELIQSLPGELGDESYPGCIEHLTSSRLDDMASRYLKALSTDAGDATRITDKLPLNYLNIGLISLLFPGARIIHCTRDPLDTCFSCWGNSFSARMAFTADFKTLGQAYMDYARLMDHWKETPSIPILDVHYEQLVQEPEPVAREIIEFIGLDWNPACLKHHESSRVARTLSMDQVNAPITTSSVGRSRRYWDELAPLRDALGELAPDDPGS